MGSWRTAGALQLKLNEERVAERGWTPLTDGIDEAEHEVRAAIHTAAIWLYAAVATVLDRPEREDRQALAQQRVRDYHLEVLRAAVAYHWLLAPPEDRAAE
jgi:hypothetical protein